MKNHLRPLVLVALAALVLSAGVASAADWVRIVGMTPASPATLAGVPPSTPMAAGNSVEVEFAYNLETHPTGRIGFYTAGVPGNPPHTGVEVPVNVAKGQGKGKTRFSVQCAQGFPGCTITSVRFNLFFDGPPLVKLFEGHQAVAYKFVCRTATGPNDNPNDNPTGHPNGRKPNITSARPGLYIWGSDPTHKHWVAWGTAVNLTAAEAINPHPSPGNGQCAFNVEYYEKETNGVATGNFRNKIFSDANERAINGPWALAASEARSHVTQPYLDEGAHGLKLVFDADGSVGETNEGDNGFSIRYILKGKCLPLAAPAGAAAPK